MNGILWVLVAWLVLAALCAAFMAGRPRWRITVPMAFACVLCALGLIVCIFIGGDLGHGAL